MPVDVNELNANAMGGTELMCKRIESAMPEELMDQVQLIPSRVRELDAAKARIYYCQDMAEDPESQKALANGGWRRFHRVVFASNWQMQNFIRAWNIPWSKCLVIQNAIEPIEPQKIADGKIKFIYHSTPHRGLNILSAVFTELRKKYENVELDVYSSFKLYGWEQRDAEYHELFDKLKATDGVRYHGTVSNEEVRKALSSADVFAYPCIWSETSCLSLIEAMSAGCVSIHPNLGALFETSGQWTSQYQFHEDQNSHAGWFYQVCEHTIKNWNSESLRAQVKNAKAFVDVVHNWNHRQHQWRALFEAVVQEPREIAEELFLYNS